MRKVFILAGILAFFNYFAKANSKDTAFRKDILNKTDIEVVYGHYLQNGNNSAVTGGIGTEKLTVYSPGFKIKRVFKNHTFNFKGGADIISSASTDNIDFVKSSASLVDARTYANVGYGRTAKKGSLIYSIGTGFSIESDYFSLPVNLGISKRSSNKLRTCGLDIIMYFDDLRWGRLNPHLYRPDHLIYPVELRSKDWYETYRRKSYNFKFSLTQIINKRNIISLNPELSVQDGLLSTPFHRVYFSDGVIKVENLPYRRNKMTLGMKWNSFIGGRTIQKSALDFYSDDFGIKGLAIESETSLKINQILTLSPFIRGYTQNGSRYFAPYMKHTREDSYYTSDYDLSKFQTLKIGLSFRYAPFKYFGNNFVFNDIVIRYAYFYRSNGLDAHILSCVFNLTHKNKRTK